MRSTASFCSGRISNDSVRVGSNGTPERTVLIAALTSSRVASNHSPSGRRMPAADERGVDLVVCELAAVLADGRLVEQDLDPVEVRVRGAELLLDPLPRGPLGRLPDLDQAGPGRAGLPRDPLPRLGVLADDRVGVDAVDAHCVQAAYAAAGASALCLSPPGRWLAGIGESSERFTERGLIVASM